MAVLVMKLIENPEIAANTKVEFDKTIQVVWLKWHETLTGFVPL